MRPLLLLNPHAASGRALRLFRVLEPLLPQLFAEFHVAITQRLEEVAGQLRQGAEGGCDTLLALGGDGTNQVILNALAAQPELRFTLGTLPLGTGRDWSRTLGIPLEPEAALRWLRAAEPRPVDVGRMTIRGHSRLFLNVASAGLSGEVTQRVNRASPKRPWTFVRATVGTLLQFGPPPMRVLLDGQPWYEGDSYLLAVANGRYFGRGMRVAPEAQIDDGLFDVVLVEGMSRPQVLAALPSLFQGSHIHRADVHMQRARHVQIEALRPPLGLEADGEPHLAQQLTFELLPGVLPMLVHPSGIAG